MFNKRKNNGMRSISLHSVWSKMGKERKIQNMKGIERDGKRHFLTTANSGHFWRKIHSLCRGRLGHFPKTTAQGSRVTLPRAYNKTGKPKQSALTKRKAGWCIAMCVFASSGFLLADAQLGVYEGAWQSISDSSSTSRL